MKWGFHNAKRGLRIADTGFSYYSEGANGVVFVDHTQHLICKLYRRRANVTEDHCKEAFQTEIDAYAIASKADELIPLVPTYFGPRLGQIVTDSGSNDVTSEFYPNLAFEAEFVSCSFQDFINASSEEQEKIRDLFGRYRIFSLNDSSICLKDGKIVKVIDFATKPQELWWG